ncbi:MAG: ATP-binding protein [Candidatus Omnitrophica bacterium]|nr:ATP-binding protein [Candidatus Omnitrophota bacterium]
MMRIPSEVSYIRKISAEIESYLKANNIEDSAIFDIRLCAEEAVKNAILHGNGGKKDKAVFISYSLEGGRFTLEVEDEGNGFDPRMVPDPTAEDNLLKGSGRGVFLIHKLMDEVKYNSRGNRIFMVKLINKNNGGKANAGQAGR